MPLVEAAGTDLLFVEFVNRDKTYKLKTVSKVELVRIHDSYAGGNDVVYLERC